ncbi:hypothetical protein H5410_063435 [Solanum commersonii]|uniref:Uncharacterized protein n=1 Tax=Solanum commersonii TaxID=4109 RepID=A0A9J5WDU5_SOLCO|nr:hypothetical protein H5410_063435 [Solanum commersonii]
MDQTGVHSPKNVEKAIVLGKGEKTKEVIREYPKPEPETADPGTEDSDSNEYNPLLDQFAQDPNEDNDSRMSFDSELPFPLAKSKPM